MRISLPEEMVDRFLIPGPSGEGFNIGLYLEHLEEASFLYEQRISLLDDPELAWSDLHDFEERFEAHIDALVLGEQLALAVCRQRAEGGDFGELHAAVRVFCRQDRQDLVDEVLDALDPQDDERVKAVADALCRELPEEWRLSFVQKWKEGLPAYKKVAVRALGYRRLPVAAVLLEALPRATDDAVLDIIWALGRLRDPSARPLLYNTYLKEGDASVKAAAALALLRMGEPSTLQHCVSIARSQPWALLPIGLGGSQSNTGLLVELAASDGASPECMLALGLLGDVSAVEPLLYHLGNARLAEKASIGLYLITGAPLFEDVFIPELLDEDELFEDERAHLERDDRELPNSVEQRGETISRLSQQPEIWQDWWLQNKSSFERGTRYRTGRLYGAARLLENLTTEQSPRLVRWLAAEELVIRYNIDSPLEIDLFVAHQMDVLADLDTRITDGADRIDDGRWVLAGRAYPR